MKPQRPTPCFRPTFVDGKLKNWSTRNHRWKLIPESSTRTSFYQPAYWYCIYCRRIEIVLTHDDIQVNYEGDNAGAPVAPE